MAAPTALTDLSKQIGKGKKKREKCLKIKGVAAARALLILAAKHSRKQIIIKNKSNTPPTDRKTMHFQSISSASHATQ